MWGEVWGSASTPVPMLGAGGLFLLVAMLIAAAALKFSKQRGARLTLLMLVGLAVPLVAIAGTVVIPNSFSNGQIADADDVNQNFSTLATESNAQDSRITILEALPPGSEGPQGPEGPEGPQGPQGIHGPQGPIGYWNISTTSIANNTNQLSSMPCVSADYTAVSGACGIRSGVSGTLAGPLAVLYSGPNPSNHGEWQCHVLNDSGSAKTVTVGVHCVAN